MTSCASVIMSHALKANMIISPVTIFQGDTVTVDCMFGELGSVSWYLNANKISDGPKYNTSSTKQGAIVLYTLKIRSVADADKGNYTCSLNSSGTLKSQSKVLGSIKTLQISQSNDVDSFCDGPPFTLTCCSADIGEFNVSWNTSGLAANITVQSPVELSRRQNLNVTCHIDIEVANIKWAKDTDIVASGKYLLKDRVPSSWAGTYFCIAYQGSLSTNASLTVIVIPLPSKEEITVHPLQTYLKTCENTALVPLTCCVNGSGYTRNFTHGSPLIPVANPNCSSTSVTFNCNTKTPASVSCMIFNRRGDFATSDAMTISYEPGPGENCKAQKELPETPSGKTYAVPCQTRDTAKLGTLTYTCRDGSWSEPVDECYSTKVFQELLNVQDVLNGTAVQVQQSLSELLSNISITATSEKETIQNSSKTLELMVTIISSVGNTNVTVDKTMMKFFMETVDVVVDKPSAWEKVSNQSATILNSVETFAKNLNFTDTISIKNESANKNIQLFGQIMSKATDYNGAFSFQNVTGSVFIDKNKWPGISSSVITIAYSTMKDILPKDSKKVVNGLVMSTILGNSSIIDGKTLTISMSFKKSNASLVAPDCVWFDLEKNIWNNSGCEPSDENGTITCSCNHLTSFSVLMGDPDPAGFVELITYIGVGISLACLVITLLIEALVWTSVIKNKTSYVRHVCLVNIAVTLLVADIWFIIGAALEKTKDKSACKAAAFFSFFFYLSLFFWMLTTGLILFYRLIYILHDMSRKTMMIIAFLLGYGCPLLITIITVASTEPRKRFISDKFCWLDYGNDRPFLAFVVPALTIVFINMLILLVVIFKLMRPTVGEKPGREERQVLIVIAKTMAVLTPLLGTTWGFGLGVVADPTNKVFNAIFSALNSFQGLFILVSTVLLDQKVRTAVRSSISSSYLRTLRSRVQDFVKPSVLRDNPYNFIVVLFNYEGNSLFKSDIIYGFLRTIKAKIKARQKTLQEDEFWQASRLQCVHSSGFHRDVRKFILAAHIGNAMRCAV
ncbi:PREDICTED: adhesion G protein-coupled receptor F5-like [Nanorana parkeri]|uniref:adhesion G protein-coupled receptor F5-like n=1 Tax=Nanorana parkeri TaxID=125878 RepID=UPI000854C83D|nr:PREDICTED: adhesion G protein-coupled receptor F5-like [Nanorana parkeri]